VTKEGTRSIVGHGSFTIMLSRGKIYKKKRAKERMFHLPIVPPAKKRKQTILAVSKRERGVYPTTKAALLCKFSDWRRCATGEAKDKGSLQSQKKNPQHEKPGKRW